ncbi:MAG: YIP1 family protein [Terriglobales bacterium]
MATPTPTPIPAAEPRQMSSPARLLGVFYAPQKVMADLVREPHFILTWVVQGAVALAFGWVALHRVGATAMAEQILRTKLHGQEMDPQQFAAQVQTVARFLPWQFGLSWVFVPLQMVFFAAIFFAAANFLMGLQARFKQVLGIVSHALLPMSVLYLLATAIFAVHPDPASIPLENPIASNAAYFMDPTSTGAVLLTLAKRLDLFVIWSVVLLGLGLAALSRKDRPGNGLAVSFSLWGVFVLVTVAYAALFP